MSNHIIEQLPERSCAKCGQPKGDFYSFYYGKFVSTTSSSHGRVTVRKDSYDIAGEKRVALCDECIRHQRIVRSAIFGVIFVLGAGLALWAANMNIFADSTQIRQAAQSRMLMFGIAGILGLIGCWNLFTNLFTSKKTYAEDIIIALKKSPLCQQGFDSFWNHKNFNKMSRG